MALRASDGRWLRRDKSRIIAVLVWMAFGTSVLLFFTDLSAISRRAQPQPEITQSGYDNELYTGSIIFIPPTGERCWQRMLDNRDGKLWDKGYVSCDEAISQLLDSKRHGGTAVRLRKISKVFRHDGG